jgi:exonuclease III
MNQLCFEYVVLSWNVRGLGETDKCDLIRNAICAVHPHIACLQESKLSHLDANKAKSFLSSNLSDNATLPANAMRGGMVTTWNPTVLSAGAPSCGLYTLTIPFTSTSSDYTLTVTNVYTPADHRDTDSFLAELSSIQINSNSPWLLISDFNLTRASNDKNTPSFNSGLANRFNTTIDSLALLELPLLDRRYTWSNKHDQPTLAKLDRALINN